jgi:hypothetical protein
MATAIKKTISTDGLISTGKAAHLLNCSAAYILALTRNNLLSATLIDQHHYFHKAAIETFAAARRARAESSATRTTDSAPTYRHHGNSIVAILRENSGPRITTRDINAAHREHYADERSATND